MNRENLQGLYAGILEHSAPQPAEPLDQYCSQHDTKRRYSTKDKLALPD